METGTVKEDNSEVQSNTSAPKYKVIDIDSVINGKCSAGEANIAINGVVARVVVDRCNFDDFFANKTKPLESEDTKTRGKKRTLEETTLEDPSSEDANKSSLEPKKKRGRPKKLIQIDPEPCETSGESDTESVQPKEVRKRGRPKKSETGEKVKHEPESKQLNRIKAKLYVENRRFNGGNTSSDSGHVSTSRVRKPNSRLQDFVVSSAVRCYAQSPQVNKPVKEVAAMPKEKLLRKATKDVMDDPLKISNNSDDDVIDRNTPNAALNPTRNGDEVVRSFLPVFDDSLPSDESDDLLEQPSKSKKLFKEKENQVNNLQVKLSKNSPKPKSFKSDEDDYSPPKLRSENDTKSKISTPKHQKNVTKNITLAHQKKLGNNSIDTQEKRQNSSDDENSTVVKPTAAVTNVACDPVLADAKMNGSNSAVKQRKTNAKYVLVDSDGARNRNKPPKVGDVDFNKLVRSLKLVKLPAANWKIRIVVSKQQTITEVTFTNKEINERCIKFSRTIAGYVITFGKSMVNLLGAPTKISSFNDVSILLDIVHNISPNDTVLEYSTCSNV